MTMINTKTLMLATFAALSLGAGAAYAQNLTPSSGEANFLNTWPPSNPTPAAKGQVESGASDLNAERPGTARFIFDNHLYGAGGVSG
jgi:hypothetical protein